MLFGELPDLEETASGKDLIRIGEKLAWEEAILAFLATRYGTVPAAIQEKIAKLTPAEAKRMMQFLAQCQSLDEVTQWLARPKAKGRRRKSQADKLFSWLRFPGTATGAAMMVFVACFGGEERRNRYGGISDISSL